MRTFIKVVCNEILTLITFILFDPFYNNSFSHGIVRVRRDDYLILLIKKVKLKEVEITEFITVDL